MPKRSFVVQPSSLFQAPVVFLQGGQEVHEGAPSVVKYKYIKSDLELAEWGALPLVYPIGHRHRLYDVSVFLEARDSRGSRNAVDVKTLTWAESTKRRIYLYRQPFVELRRSFATLDS